MTSAPQFGRTSRPPLAASLAIALVISSCGLGDPGAKTSEPSPPSHSAIATTHDAVPGPVSFDLRLRIRIGNNADERSPVLGVISAVAPLAAGGAFICDRFDTQVLLFDASGTFVRNVGRRGAGPAEYRSCDAMLIAEGDSLLIGDPSNGRIDVFDSNGAFVEANEIRAAGFYGENTFGLDRERRMILTLAMRPGPRQPGEHELLEFVIWHRSGDRAGSVIVPSRRTASLGRGFALSTADGDRLSVPPDTVWTLGRASDIFVANPLRYSVTRFTRGGQRIVFERPDVSPVPYLPEERKEWERLRSYVVHRNRLPLAASPALKPIIRELFVDAQGRLWVGRYTRAEKREIGSQARAVNGRPSLTYRERNVYDVFDIGSARFLGEVSLPANSRIAAFSPGHVWLVEESDSGLQTIAKYQVEDSRPLQSSRSDSATP